jgi:uncharacterized membrane protein SpoIIM required for sporulation
MTQQTSDTQRAPDIRELQWSQLEDLCTAIEQRSARRLGAAAIVRFGELYRAACADLALADAKRLSPATVHYLHQLVGRAHNQLYRSREFDFAAWRRLLLQDVPRQIFSDRCLQVAFFLFWLVFVAAAALSADEKNWPGFAESLLSTEQLDRMEDSFADPLGGRASQVNAFMAGFYIQHNMSIGLQCFLGGLLVIPGLLITLFNAASIGAAFGYMARPDVAAGQNFFEFVMAHGPFELTAVVLSAAAGLRLGVSWITAGEISRADALRQAAADVMPMMGAALLLFFLAALIEGFVSPSSLPMAVKAAVAMLSSGLLCAYFVILGFPREPLDAA